jgi:oligosaccharyl transferase (archaeosortase A-associated)
MGGEKRIEYFEVLAILLLGLLLRIYAGRNAIQGGNVLFQGVDDYYHMRRALYTVTHFPNTISFDSYIDYPFGTNITWPPLWDQLIAGSSLVLGQHSQHGIEMVGAALPIIVGSMAIIVVYIMIRKIFGRNVALMSAFMTALAPFFLIKTMLGAADHHGLEVLLFLCSVMFLILAISTTNRRPILAAASGVSMAALAYTWAGAAAYFSVILIYFVVQMTIDLAKKSPPSKDVIITVLTSLGIALVLTLPFWSKEWMSSSFFGLVVIAAAVIFLFGLGKIIYHKNFNWATFPVVVLGLAGVLVIISRLFFSSLPVFERVNALIISGGEYIFSGGMIGLISEAEPLFSRPHYLFINQVPTNMGWNLLLSVVALAVLIRHMWLTREAVELRRGQLLFLVFAVYSLILTMGQVRFFYLSSIATGILISILFYKISEYIIKRSGRSDICDNRSKILLALLFLFLVLPTVSEDISYTYIVPQIAGDWYESLNWLEQNSNKTSYYDEPNKTPEYSIMSWWDNGNWIIYESQRPVVANNFQLGVEDSTRFFLSKNEEAATAILDNRSSRYIITDSNMLYGKLPGIALWAGENPSDYINTEHVGTYLAITPTKNLSQTVLARLHIMDGSTMGHMRLIYESPTAVGSNPKNKKVKIFEYVQGAIIRVTTEHKQQVVSILNMTSNQGRSFSYYNLGSPLANICEIRVPYSTEKKYDTHAIAAYTVFFVDSSGILKYKKINVTEEDVMKGKTIEVKL